MAYCLCLCLVVATAAPRLSYVRSASGLYDNPWLEGGRTELEFADIDNDGNLDILSIGDHGSPWVNTQERGVMVWFGDGQGNWTVYLPSDTLGYGGIAVGDVNWDGHWDVGYGMHHNYARGDLGDQLIEVALGDGTGRHWIPWDDSLAQNVPGLDWGMFSTDFADIDNDGHLDVGSISFGANDGIHVYRNRQNGAWHRTFGFVGGNSRMEFYFRDVNRDGDVDFIAAHGSGTVWFGNGRGGFTPMNTGLPSSSYGLSGVSVGDVDNDGGCDVAFCNTGGGVEVWRWDNPSQGWRSFSGTLPPGGSFGGTQLCDMNADGFMDVCALGGGLVKVWTGDGAGNWSEAATITIATSGSYSAFRAGWDFDHNGRPDLTLVLRETARNMAYTYREASPTESLGVFPVFPRGGEVFAMGSAQFVDWWSAAPNAAATRVRLELSTRGQNGPWQLIVDSLRNAGRYQWRLPTFSASDDCHIRYTVYGPGGSVSGITPRPFEIAGLTGVIEPHDPPLPASGGRAGFPRLYPNPATERLTVEMDSDMTEPMEAVLLDVAGREAGCWRWPARSGAVRHTTSLDLSGLPAGTYFLRLATHNSFVVRRLVKHDLQGQREVAR